ncbi:hypothetical protein BB560_003880 [Smittium megazygosporum]|uniref:2-(3-amino-3-carboxypropyl)histidine synthase subunit 1 n=1 Tax=Smittium megazygosporum TaxID=133381 RepID=A0A2T9ZAW0_9FUNG|nr:hypothetical protein BB560_004811 [Smittium megazygosporum]PVV01695.1 hypothetical protein BB560_003880 [Smittium megazygosporum]
MSQISSTPNSSAVEIKKVVRRRVVRTVNAIPENILNNEELNQAIKLLPANYNFEIHKTVWHIEKNKATRVALQFPEGLLMYSCIISDILETFCKVEVVIMGDVTYGACCIDDYSAISLGCDFMVHYGHSCLVPVNTTKIKTMYVFVEIGINTSHFIETVKLNFKPNSRLCFVGIVQFLSSLHYAKKQLEDQYTIIIPQSKPLSPGEVLGCTSPRLPEIDAIVFLGDGRFHLESILIHNPGVPAYAYDPYSKKLTIEKYNHEQMYNLRQDAINTARKAKRFGLILGTLGRQGSPKVLEDIEARLIKADKEYTIVLLSEIYPQKLDTFSDIDCWIQIACPRLSIDWGYAFSKPLLSPYELSVALGNIKWQQPYPMDFYSNESLGTYTPNHIKIPVNTSIEY